MARRTYYENRESFSAARKLREDFMDRDMERVEPVHWEWPRTMDEIGVCTAVMYSSDKWRSPGDFIDYKHISEAPQTLLIPKDGDFGSGVELYTRSVELDRPMPDAFAKLARVLGIQCQLFGRDGEVLDQYYQVNITRAELGAAKHPITGETFLIFYTAKELVALVTGTELDVEKDGIVG